MFITLSKITYKDASIQRVSKFDVTICTAGNVFPFEDELLEQGCKCELEFKEHASSPANSLST